MANITQETREQNIERNCIELARCPRNDKVVFGKQMKGYGMRMPEGLGFCDALDWIAEYLNKVYGPDAIDITVRVRALEKSDVGDRPMLIESEDGDQIEKAELGMNDTFLPDGSPASRCPFHIHLRMNTLMAEDFEELGDSFAESASPAPTSALIPASTPVLTPESAQASSAASVTASEFDVNEEDACRNTGRVDIIEGIASIDPATKSIRTVLDLSFVGYDDQESGAHYPPTELLIRCPDPHLALDIIETVEDSVFGSESDDDEPPAIDIPQPKGEEHEAALEYAREYLRHIRQRDAGATFLRQVIEIYDDAAQENLP
ncbi:MAG: hypothetical protein IKQ93_06270 [Candidatus Methanomethylophilaceae archaeon]|nr:hypothetical protein [Candidatus Methanomethylophilaceae archaeon]